MSLGSAAHIDFQLRHAGELVVFGAQKGYGLLDLAPVDLLDPTLLRIKGTKYTLAVREGFFTGLTEDTTITHGGTDYTIKDLGNAGTDGLRRLVVIKGTGNPAPTAPNTFGGGAVFG